MLISITITEQFTLQEIKKKKTQNTFKNSHLIQHSCVTAQ